MTGLQTLSKMKSFPAQPRLHYFVLSSLILVFLRGVTSQDDVMIIYNGPPVVFEGTQISFTGTTRSASSGLLPTDVSFFIRNKGNSKVFQICNVDYGDCSGSSTDNCYCTAHSGDTYSFVIKDKATTERSEAEISGYIGILKPETYPKITKATTTTESPTTGTSTDSTDVTNDNVTFTTVTTGVGGDSVSPTVTVSTTPQIDTTDGPTNTTETTPGGGGCDRTCWILIIVFGVCALIVVVLISVFCWKKKLCCCKGAPVKTGDPSPTTVELGTTCNNGRATSQ